MPQQVETEHRPIKFVFDRRLAQSVADEQWRAKREGRKITPREAMQALRERGELETTREPEAQESPQENPAQDRFDDFLTAHYRFRFGCIIELLTTSEKLDLYCISHGEIAPQEWLEKRYPDG